MRNAVAGGKKKKKRPLKDGTYGPRKPDSRGRARGRSPGLSRRQIRRVSVLLAVLTPLVLIGLAMLAANPDYGLPAVIVELLMAIGALGLLMMLRPSGWFLWPGLVLLGALMLLPWQVFQAEIIHYRGVRTDVVITAAHSSHKKGGGLAWSCAIRRADGLPLKNPKMPINDCWGQDQVGTTTTIMVDPDGWVAPMSTDEDYSGLDYGVAGIGGVAVLWALLVLGAGRLALRGAADKPKPKLT